MGGLRGIGRWLTEPTSGRGGHWRANVGLGLLFIATVALCVMAWEHSYGTSASAAPLHLPSSTTAKPAPAKPAVVFVGDSYTDGQGSTSASWAEETARRLGLRYDIAADRGAGYVTKGQSGETMRSLVAQYRVDPSMDNVVIAAGFNDFGRGYPLQRIGEAASATFALMKHTWPNAKIVVVGPWSITDDPAPSRIALRNVIEHRAEAAGLPFVDAYPWKRDTPLGPDGIHPTQAGHDAIARDAARELRPLLDLGG